MFAICVTTTPMTGTHEDGVRTRAAGARIPYGRAVRDASRPVGLAKDQVLPFGREVVHLGCRLRAIRSTELTSAAVRTVSSEYGRSSPIFGAPATPMKHEPQMKSRKSSTARIGEPDSHVPRLRASSRPLAKLITTRRSERHPFRGTPVAPKWGLRGTLAAVDSGPAVPSTNLSGRRTGPATGDDHTGRKQPRGGYPGTGRGPMRWLTAPRARRSVRKPAAATLDAPLW